MSRARTQGALFNAGLGLAEAESLAPTVEALIRDAVREALTEAADAARECGHHDGFAHLVAYHIGLNDAARIVLGYRDEHYPEP